MTTLCQRHSRAVAHSFFLDGYQVIDCDIEYIPDSTGISIEKITAYKLSVTGDDNDVVEIDLTHKKRAHTQAEIRERLWCERQCEAAEVANAHWESV